MAFFAPGSDDVSPLQALKRTLQMDNAPLPDFSQHTDVRAKKQAFFDYLQPIVAANNQRVLMIGRACVNAGGHL